MPFENLPVVGSLYYANYKGIPWSQPGGPGTQVFPAQQIGTPFTQYPTTGQSWAENSGLWTAGCLHWFNFMSVFSDFDQMLGTSVAVLACPLCSFIIRYQAPYSSIDNPFNFPILIP